MANEPKKINGAWQIRAFWYSPDGKRHSKQNSGFDTKRQAITWAVNYENSQKNLEYGKDNMLLKDYLDDWLEMRKPHIAPNTYRGYKVNIEHVKTILGNYPLCQIKKSHVQKMIDKLEGKRKTKEYIRSTLRAALQSAVDDEIIQSNPARKIEFADDDEIFERHTMDSKDMGKMLSEMKLQRHILYAMTLLCVTLGLRRGEALGLTWDNVDFEEQKIYITQQYTRDGGNGAIIKKLKTRGSARTEYIPQLLKSELLEIKEYQLANGNIENFICSTNGELPNLNYVNEQFKKFLKANGFYECRIHDIRHSFAEMQLENGTDIKTLSVALGHSKTAITTDTYLGKNEKLSKKVARKVDNVIKLNA